MVIVVKNIKDYSPLKKHSGLTRKCHAPESYRDCHYSNNLTLRFMAKLKLRFILIAFVSMFSVCQIHAQGLRVPTGDYKSSIGTAISTGFFVDKPAVFFGYSVDYSYVFNKKFIILGGLAYDQEHTSKTGEDESGVVHSLTPTVTIGYVLTPKFAMGIGFGKALWDTDNTNQKLRFTGKGNITAGLMFSYTFYSKGHSSFDLGGGVEQGIITPETDVTLEIGYAYSF